MSDNEFSVGQRNALCGIIDTAREFADPTFQRRVWIEGKGSEVSSYREAIATLFDDYHVSDFLGSEALKYGLSSKAVAKLIAFVSALNTFDVALPPTMGEADIVKEPDWQNIIRSAGDFLDSSVEWLGHNCSDFPMFEWTWNGQTFGQSK